MTQETLRFAVAGMSLALFAWMAARSIFLRRRGVAVIAISAQGNAVQRLLILGAGLYELYLVLRAPFRSLDADVLAFPSPAPGIAAAVIAFGALVTAAAQANMGRSWKVGVPSTEDGAEAFVSGGLYRLSRNPVYLGIMIFLAGTVLAAPGPLSAAALVIGFAGLTRIIRQEEAHLSARFGETYEAYCRRVRRWI